MKRLLFTGGGGAGSEALFQILSDRFEVHFADADIESIPKSIPSSHRHAIPLAGPPWGQAIAQLCTWLKVDLFIPTVDEELHLLPSLRALIPDLAILAPDDHFIRLTTDKLQLYEAFLNHDIRTPATRTMSGVPEIIYPVFAKPRRGRGSRGIQLIRNVDQWNAYLTLAEQEPNELLAQEWLQGTEWTVCVCADRFGQLQQIIPMKIGRKRGITLRATVQIQNGILDYCQKIHNAFMPKGCYNIQLMELHDGALAAFEINPRVSTTLCLAIKAGGDPIGIFLGVPPSLVQEGWSLYRNWFNAFVPPEVT